MRALDAAFAAEPRPLTVLGWSLGGQLALAWALARPERVARLVLVGTTPRFVAGDGWDCAMSRQTLERFGDELHVSWRATVLRFLTLQMRGSEHGHAALALLRRELFARGEPSRATLREALALLVATDLRADAGRVAQPVLVVTGNRDTLAPAAAGAWLAADPAERPPGGDRRRRARAVPVAPGRIRPRRSRRFSMNVDPSPDADPSALEARAVRRHFARAAATYDAAAVLQREVGTRMVERLDVVRLAPAAILDAGCGTGEALPELAARYPRARRVALDVALPMLAAARVRTRERRSLLGRLLASGRRPDGKRAFVRLRRRGRPSLRSRRVRARLEQPHAAVGRRSAARARRAPSRPRGGRARDVHDVRTRHAEGAACRVPRRRRAAARRAFRRHARHRRPARPRGIRGSGDADGDVDAHLSGRPVARP